MRLVFIILLFATTAQAQFVINPYVFAAAGAGIAEAYANEKSIDLDGSLEYVDIGDQNEFSFTDGAGNDEPFTLSAWVYLDVNQVGYIISKDNDVSNVREWTMYYNTAGTGFVLRIDDGTDVNAKSIKSTAVSLNKWYHVAATYNGGEQTSDMQIYVNGVSAKSTQDSIGTYTGMINTAQAVAIGRDNGNIYYFDGKIDQVAVWDTVLNIDEIKEMMAIRDYNYHSRAANLISWWDFDEDTTGTDGITDLIGTFDGTMTNGEYADLNTHITFPYAYQLDSNAVWDSITPFQYGFTDSIHGGFNWDFDNQEYIIIPDQDSLSFGNGTTDSPFSACAWARADAFPPDGTNLIAKDNNASGNKPEWYLSWNGNEGVTFGMYEPDLSGRIYATTSTDIFKLNQSYHVCGTYDGGGSETGINIWINADSVTNSQVEDLGTYTSMTAGTSPVYINSERSLNRQMDGKYGDVIIFNKELSSAEIDSIYNNHSPRDETKYGLSGNIVGYWRPYNSTNNSTNILDQSGNSYNGTAYNTEDVDFAYGYPREILDSAGSFDFDGSAEYIDVDSVVADVSSQNVGTISFWIKPIDNGANVPGFFIGDGAFTFAQHRYINSSQRFQFYIQRSSGNYMTYYPATTFPRDQWHHVVFVQDASSPVSYINGVQRTATPATAGSGAATDWFNDLSGLTTARIAATNVGAGDTYVQGQMNHVSILDKALSYQEIIELYNDGSPVDITKVTFAANVVSHWKMDQTDDPTGTVTDIVGDNDGTAIMMEAGDLKTDIYPTN